MSGVTQSKKLSLAWILLIILTLIWGTSFILIKKGLEAFSAGEVGALRIFSAGVVLLPIAFFKLKRANFIQAFYIFIVGFVGSLIPAFLFAKAETQIDSGIAGVLNALTPLFVLLVGAMMFNQSITRRMSLGLFIGLVGTIILITSGQSLVPANLNFYAFFILLATICYGLNVNLIKFRLKGVGAITITSLSMVFVLPITGFYLFFISDFRTHLASVPDASYSFFYVVMLGVMSTAIAMVLFNKLVQLVSPVFASMVTYLIPIVALAWGIMDGELVLPRHYIGMVTILAGVYITTRTR